MKKAIVLMCIFCWCCTQVCAQKQYTKYAARFGKRAKRLKTAPANVVRIFMDKEGSYYPDLAIRDKDLRRCNNTLSEWYKTHSASFAQLCRKYDVRAAKFGAQLDQVNEGIAKELAAAINKQGDRYKTVTLSVHGFSKSAYGFNIVNRHSDADNERLEKAMDKRGANTCYVEVYWDGTKVGFLHSVIGNLGYKIFRNRARRNALNVGLGLRRTVDKIHNENINIITHSLGARVGCALLFNADSSNTERQMKYPTPSQGNIKLCMVAPATGAELFRHYYQRGNEIVSPEDDHYKIAVVYNTNDVVLNKGYPGLIRIGRKTAEDIAPTTLGCDYGNDLDSLRMLLAPKQPRTFNLSNKKGKPQLGHYLIHIYVKNRDPFGMVANYLNRTEL